MYSSDTCNHIELYGKYFIKRWNTKSAFLIASCCSIEQFSISSFALAKAILTYPLTSGKKILLRLKYSIAQLMQTARSSPGHKSWQWCYLKWRRWKAQRKKQAVLSTACLKITSVCKGGGTLQETEKSVRQNVCVLHCVQELNQLSFALR